MTLKIDIFMSESCGSYYKLRENMDHACAELDIDVDVDYQTIYYDDAVSRNIKGSPSIWINGTDAFEGGNSPGITWRMYLDESGRLNNVPSVEMLKQAIKRER